MADPLYNASCKAAADNNAIPAALNRFTMRVSTVAPATGDELVANQTFEVEAGTAITLHYDIRKFGAGPQLDTPTEGRIRIFKDRDNLDARAGAVFESADLIGGNALPRTGSVSFTPTESGTYRIQCEMQKDNGNFGATSDDWRIISDGFFQAGGISSIQRRESIAKGRLRAGHKITAIDLTERGSAAPNPFAFRMNAAGTASEEAVRIDVAQEKTQNKTTTREVYRIRHRRNGTGTLDGEADSSIISGTQHRLEKKVTLLDFPLNNIATTYDALVEIQKNSELHDLETPQYTGLSGSAASGVWVHFVSEATFFVDYKTAQKLASHVVNPGGSIENVFCKDSDAYTEDASQIPQGSEDSGYISTAQNMTVKCGRVLNARGEALFGVFVHCRVLHAASGAERDSWGNNAASFKTLANGWVDDPRIVVVSTPPAGLHELRSTAYFPGTTFGAPASREFSVTRDELGSPAGVGAGKDWIAPAEFMQAEVIAPSPVKGGTAVAFVLRVYEKAALADADAVPPCKIYKGTAGTLFAQPTLTKRAATTGIYDGTFTPDPIAVGGGKEIYEISAAVTIKGTQKTFSEPVTVLPFEPATHAHLGSDGSVAIGDRS